MKVKRFVIFSLSMVISYTLACTIITAITGIDLSQYHVVFCGIFGGELVMSCLLKLLGDKKDDNTIGDDPDNNCMEDDV